MGDIGKQKFDKIYRNVQQARKDSVYPLVVAPFEDAVLFDFESIFDECVLEYADSFVKGFLGKYHATVRPLVVSALKFPIPIKRILLTSRLEYLPHEATEDADVIEIKAVTPIYFRTYTIEFDEDAIHDRTSIAFLFYVKNLTSEDIKSMFAHYINIAVSKAFFEKFLNSKLSIKLESYNLSDNYLCMVYNTDNCFAIDKRGNNLYISSNDIVLGTPKTEDNVSDEEMLVRLLALQDVAKMEVLLGNLSKFFHDFQ